MRQAMIAEQYIKMYHVYKYFIYLRIPLTFHWIVLLTDISADSVSEEMREDSFSRFSLDESRVTPTVELNDRAKNIVMTRLFSYYIWLDTTDSIFI